MEKKVLIEEIVTLMNKVNRQTQLLGHLPHVARIDVDLLLAQIRQVYDKALDLQMAIEPARTATRSEAGLITPRPGEQQAAPAPTPPPKPKSQEAQSFDFDFSTPSTAPASQPAVEPVATPPVPEPVAPPTPEPVHPEPHSEPAVHAGTTHSFGSTPTTTPAGTTAPKSVHEAYEQQAEDHSLAARLQYNPIHDLRSAIGINDKFLLMNQLFKGSMEQYNAAIERLNGFHNYGDAEIYLGSLRIMHDWPEESPAVDRLVYFVRRRYQQE